MQYWLVKLLYCVYIFKEAFEEYIASLRFPCAVISAGITYRIYDLISSTPFLMGGKREVMVPRWSGFIREALLRSICHSWSPFPLVPISACGAMCKPDRCNEICFINFACENTWALPTFFKREGTAFEKFSLESIVGLERRPCVQSRQRWVGKPMVVAYWRARMSVILVWNSSYGLIWVTG